MAKAAIAWYMGGLLFFFAVADWTKDHYVAIYWIWSTAKDVFFILALYLLLKDYRKCIFPVLFFSSIRAIWEIIAQILGQDINNTKIVDFLFYILLTITLIRLITGLKKQWDQNWPS